MAWTTDLVTMTRILINDVLLPQKHADSYLQQVLITAGIIVSNDVELQYNYVFDIANLTISPDPVISGDVIVQALLPLKAACIINAGQFQSSIGQAIKVRDGDSSIDTSVGFGGYRDILKLGPCNVYEKLKWQIQVSNVASSVGGLIIGAYRPAGEDGQYSIGYFYDRFAAAIANPRTRIFDYPR